MELGDIKGKWRNPVKYSSDHKEPAAIEPDSAECTLHSRRRWSSNKEQSQATEWELEGIQFGFDPWFLQV